MPCRVLAHGELRAVSGLGLGGALTGPGVSYVIHVTSVQCADYSRLHIETNAARRCSRRCPMANVQTLDPNASPLDYYGWELRRLREAAHLKQGQLGDIIFCTGS
ncbi:XRE family transcriptional regulator, partial [Streptomyces pratensis]